METKFNGWFLQIHLESCTLKDIFISVYLKHIISTCITDLSYCQFRIYSFCLYSSDCTHLTLSLPRHRHINLALSYLNLNRDIKGT